MLVLLRSRGKMKISELAKEIGVKERMIRQYRDDLEEANIHIESTKGRYGGYEIIYDNFMYDLKLTESEIKSIVFAAEKSNQEGYILIKDYISAVDKIKAAAKRKRISYEEWNYYIRDVKANVDCEDERKKWTDINSAIVTRKKIKIKYKSLRSTEERTVRPYIIFEHKGALYFVGYCELRSEIREFKFCRVDGYDILNEKFIIPKNFNFKDIIKNSFGIINDNEFYVKLNIKPPMSKIVSEKIWVGTQKITYNKDKSITFEGNMKGWIEIKNWILSMGSSVIVLEPKALLDEIKQEINEMMKNYC